MRNILLVLVALSGFAIASNEARADYIFLGAVPNTLVCYVQATQYGYPAYTVGWVNYMAVYRDRWGYARQYPARYLGCWGLY